MIKVPATGPTVNGIDVSHYQANMDWNAQKSQGTQFAFIKASEGFNHDPMFRVHVAGAKKAGILTGAYHFFHPNKDPMLQAHIFMTEVLATFERPELPPVIDWESADGTLIDVDRGAGFIFLNEIRKQSGKTPIVYGGPYFLQALKLDSTFEPFRLWVSHYGVAAPLVPPPWKTWTFWQNNGNKLDKNVFNGTIEELRAL